MDVALSVPQVAHNHADIIYLLGIKNGAWGLWYVELGLQ